MRQDDKDWSWPVISEGPADSDIIKAVIMEHLMGGDDIGIKGGDPHVP